MRRLSLCIAVCILISGCARKSDLPPEEVLRRAAQESSQMASARFSLDADISFGEAAAKSGLHVDMDGVLQNGGKEMTSDIAMQGIVRGNNEKHDVNIKGAVTLTTPKKVFLKLDTIDITPPLALFGMEGLEPYIGKWVQLPESTEQTEPAEVTADPSLLRMQAEVVHVVRDRGMTTLNGRTVYNYDVDVDPEKLLAFLRTRAQEKGSPFDEAAGKELMQSLKATGQLAIDSETFAVDELRWQISGDEKTLGGATISLMMKLTDHNAAPPVQPPENAVILQGDSPLPLSSETSSSSLSKPTIP